MKVSRRECLVWLGAGFAGVGAADRPSLPGRWRPIVGRTDGTVGVTALHLESGERARLHGAERFPLASVCKLPIAMNMLALVDEGRFALDQPIEVLPEDIVQSVSPIAKRWPAERRFPLDEMLESMVARSDNTAVETLLRIGGGPAAMTVRFRVWGIGGMRIDRSERQCGIDASGGPEALKRFIADPRDTATPDATVQLLRRLFRGELLSMRSTARMIQILEATNTGPGRLKGLLPAGTVVAHKTGTTLTAGRLTGATNDVGVITLPTGGRMAIAVYVKGSTRDESVRERVIAEVAKAAFEYWAVAGSARL